LTPAKPPDIAIDPAALLFHFRLNRRSAALMAVIRFD
jgi:hypothetical protein